MSDKKAGWAHHYKRILGLKINLSSDMRFSHVLACRLLTNHLLPPISVEWKNGKMYLSMEFIWYQTHV